MQQISLELKCSASYANCHTRWRSLLQACTTAAKKLTAYVTGYGQEHSNILFMVMNYKHFHVTYIILHLNIE